MTLWLEIGFVYLAASVVFGGFSWAMVRAGKESDAEVNPASSRMAATTLQSQVRRDVSQRFKARLAERDRQAKAVWPAPCQTHRSGGDTAA